MTAPFADRLDSARWMLAEMGTRRHPPGSPLADQQQAAERDAGMLFAALEDAFPGAAEQVDNPEALIHLLAAAQDCKPCVHVRRSQSAIPIVLDLNHRLALCPVCVGTYRTPIEDCACEVCGEETGDCLLIGFSVSFGPLVFIGTAGADCCAELLT